MLFFLNVVSCKEVTQYKTQTSALLNVYNSIEICLYKTHDHIKN